MGSFVSKPQELVLENGKRKNSGKLSKKRKRSDDDNDEEELRGHLTKKPRLYADSVTQEQSENIPRQSEEKSGKLKRSEDDEETSAHPNKKSSPDSISPSDEDREISPTWSDLYAFSSSEEDRESSPSMSDFFEGPENPYEGDLYYIPVFEAGLEDNAYRGDVGDWADAEDLYPPIIRTDSEGNAAWELNVDGWQEASNWNDDEDLYVPLDPPVIEANSEGNAARGRGVGEWREADNVNEAGSQHPNENSQNENQDDNHSVIKSEPSEDNPVTDEEEQDPDPTPEMKEASTRRYTEGVWTIRTLRRLTFDNPQEAAQNEAKIELERTRILAEKEWYEDLDSGDFQNELCDIVHKALRSSRSVENSGCQEEHHDPKDCKDELKDELYAAISAACKKERKRPKYSFPRIG
ncbi:hypothetical protein NW768_003938 [Fusarium equiseti]|uniref:Uncharacterized protein n=1 Tax=Fusarium equiseti TaxID=61235 RepID=A0ABQ8RJ17_FUSEQ|nr:hypothetical protein NW768_003938 [Fusarium equiseti]